MRHPGPSVEGARDAAHLRRLNLERVLAAAMAREGAFTRAELIEATGLSAPTVGSLATSLIRAGLLTDLGSGPSRGGRRPGHMEFNRRHGFVAAIDLGPTRTRLAVADLRGELLAASQCEHPDGQRASRLAQHTRARDAGAPARSRCAVQPTACRWCRCARRGRPGYGHDRRARAESAGVGSTCPSPPSSARRWTRRWSWKTTSTSRCLANIGKARRASTTTASSSHSGPASAPGSWSTGVLHHGHHALAGEIGLMCMGPQFVNMDFAARGCLETLAGLGALRARWRRSDDASDWLPDLFRAAAEGDCNAHTIVEEVSTLVGIAAANVSCIMDPSLVVLGGALGMQGEPLLRRVRADRRTDHARAAVGGGVRSRQGCAALG